MKAEAGRAGSNLARTLIIGVGIAALLAWSAPPAHGAGKRVFEETFGSVAQPAFVEPTAMAVDYGSGDLYVVDVGTGAKTLSRWAADGTPRPFTALGTNVIDGKRAGATKECPTVPTDCDETSQNGLSFPTGSDGRRRVQVAIDESGTATDGNIYVTQWESKLVDIFAADGRHLGQLSKFKAGPKAEGAETDFIEPCGVAVDKTGAVYVGDSGSSGSQISKYASTASPHSPLTNADNVANFSMTGLLSRPCAVAAGIGPSDGFLFFNRGTGGGRSYKINSTTGVEAGENPIVSANSTTVSVFPGSGNAFFGDGSNTIKEFDASESKPIEIASAQAASTVAGFAPSAAGERLYVSRDGATTIDVFGAALPLPALVTNEATDITATTARLNGTLARNGQATEDCRFEYLTDTAYQANKKASVGLFTGATPQTCAQSNAEIDAGVEPVAVHADLAGLPAGELFHYRLSATTFAGQAFASEKTFATTVPPTIEAEQATAITNSEAAIKVSVNPKFYPTTFRVEYGPGSSFASSTPEAAVGSDGVSHPLIATLTGLQPGTTYEWRIVATSDNGLIAESAPHSFTTYRPFAPDTACSNQIARSGLSAALPDCRAYEMVSPVDKGGDINNGPNGQGNHDAYIQATPDGGKITYSAEPAFAGQLSSRYYNQYIAARKDGGWFNSGVNLPLGRQLEATFRFEREVNAFSEDLCSMWIEDYNATPLNPDGQVGFNNLYRRQNCAPGTGDLETLTTAAPPKGTVQEYVNRDSVQGFSADGREVFFVAGAKLTTDALSIDRDQVYLHSTGDPQLHLVSVLPSGEAANPPPGSNNAIGSGTIRNQHNAVSEDGTRVFWTANMGSSGEGRVYLRLSPAEPEPTARTLEVSDGGNAFFWEATPSGSAALYSEGKLDGGTASLYRYDVGAEARTKLDEKVYGVAGLSEDLTRIYLVSGADHDSAGPAQENQPNLYLYEGGVFTLIGTLLAGDVSSGTEGRGLVATANPRFRATRATADGRHLLFQSRAPLTGYDNREASSGDAAVEVFLYGVDEGLRCVSCNPSGVRPHGEVQPQPYRYPYLGTANIPAAAWIPTWEHPLHASRILSADGNRVFFHSFDPLLPRDTNGTVQDLYQWEAAGAGSCDAGDASYFASNGGCIDLISSGTSSEEAEFFDASEGGSDVFFTTASSLVPGDPGAIDLYDARVEGGFPPPEQKAPCEGEACQSAPPAPNAATPASAAYRGPGNVKQANKRRCAKGKRRVRRQGKARCVRKHKRHQRRGTDNRRNAR